MKTPRKCKPIEELRLGLAEPRWWREEPHNRGLKKSGKFKCPMCGGMIDTVPYRVGIVKVIRHGQEVYGWRGCLFSNCLELTSSAR